MCILIIYNMHATCVRYDRTTVKYIRCVRWNAVPLNDYCDVMLFRWGVMCVVGSKMRCDVVIDVETHHIYMQLDMDMWYIDACSCCVHSSIQIERAERTHKQTWNVIVAE